MSDLRPGNEIVSMTRDQLADKLDAEYVAGSKAVLKAFRELLGELEKACDMSIAEATAQVGRNAAPTSVRVPWAAVTPDAAHAAPDESEAR